MRQSDIWGLTAYETIRPPVDFNLMAAIMESYGLSLPLCTAS